MNVMSVVCSRVLQSSDHYLHFTAIVASGTLRLLRACQLHAIATALVLIVILFGQTNAMFFK